MVKTNTIEYQEEQYVYMAEKNIQIENHEQEKREGMLSFACLFFLFRPSNFHFGLHRYIMYVFFFVKEEKQTNQIKR